MRPNESSRIGWERRKGAAARIALAAVLAAAPRLALPLQPAAETETSAATPRLDGPGAVAAAVLRANPEIQAIEETISSLEHAVPQAGVWPDPMASVEDSNVPLDEPYPGGHPMAGLQLRLQQTVPFPGKTAARTAVAASRVTAARESLAERRNRLAGTAQDLYHQLALVRQLRVVTGQHVALVGELLGVVRARYEAGGAPQHDLLQLQVLRARLEDDLEDLGRKERELLGVLLATLHLPPETPVETPESTPLTPAPPALGALVERADRERPLLRELASQAETAALSARRAEVEKRPDVTLWAGWRWRRPAGQDAGVDLYSAGVSIPLPWFWNDRRWGALARQERARERSLASERTARLDEIRGRLDAALARWRRASDKARVYEEELVPEQERTLASALASYRVGRTDFSTLYRAELELLDFERAIRTARADAARAAVDTEILAGGAAGGFPDREVTR